MRNTFTIGAAEWAALRTHLLKNQIEQAAMAYAEVEQRPDGMILSSQAVEYLEGADFDIQSAYHISLTDEAQARIIKTAWDRQAAIVEFHSHVDRDHSARFSHSDLAGFNEFVPHVWWRLRGQPYAAIVVTHSDFDALAWRTAPDRPEELLVRVDRRLYNPTRRTLQRLAAE